MGTFTSIFINLSERGSHQPAKPLDIDTAPSAQFLRRALLDRPRNFKLNVEMKSLNVRIELEWHAAGDTVGVALWGNPDHVAAVSVLLNGVEMPADMEAMHAMLAFRGYAIPYRAREIITKEPNRPLIVTQFYSRRAFGMRELATIIPVFATAYFGLFGTEGTEKTG